MKRLNELCLLRAIDAYVLNEDKIKAYHHLKSAAEKWADKSASSLKIANPTEEDVTDFEYLEIWEPFENYNVKDLLELIEAGYKGNLSFAEQILNVTRN